MSFEFNDIAKIKDRRIQTIAENCNADPEFTKGILFEEFQEKYGNCEIYSTENIKKFQDDVMKAISDSSDENQAAQILEKAKKDLSKLTHKTVVDNKGHKGTVWVKANEEKKSTSVKTKDATDHIMESGGKFQIDTLDPDTEEKKFKEGDEISFKTERGEKKTGTIGKEVQDGIHQVIVKESEGSKK